MARPHPAVWRVIHGVVVIYLLVLVFLLFQTVGDARQMLRARPRLDGPAARSPTTVEAPCMLPRISGSTQAVPSLGREQTGSSDCAMGTPVSVLPTP